MGIIWEVSCHTISNSNRQRRGLCGSTLPCQILVKAMCMRDLPPVVSKEEAEEMLRADEELFPCGGLYGYLFFSAVKPDEYGLNKEQKLWHRRQKRKNSTRYT